MISEALVETLREHDSWWSRVRATPWRDLLRGRLTGSLDYRHAMTEFDLPLPLLETVDKVVKRSGLWPRERYDVASELCAHFTDGLQAGHTADELQKTFGLPKDSAKLIRRAKVRCRSRSWQLWRFIGRPITGVLFLVAVIWSILIIRFTMATPTVKFDMVADMDDESRAIPEEDRAWPYYRRGLVQIDTSDFTRIDEPNFNLQNVMVHGPEDPEWDEAREYLLSMEETIQIFVTGTRQEQLGFINRDPANDAWRKWNGPTGRWETYNEPGTPGNRILLAHTHDLRMVFRFLQGATHLAIEDGDSPRVLTLLMAMLNLSEHVYQSFDGYIADLRAFVDIRQISNIISKSVLEHPKLFTDPELQRLSQRLHDVLGGRPFEFRAEGERRLVDDFVQQIYTDDGEGNGRLTSKGLRLLQQTASSWSEKNKYPLLDDLPLTSDDEPVELTDDAWYQLLGSAAVAMIGDRQSVHEKMIELFEFRHEAFSDPLTPFNGSEFSSAVTQLLASPDRLRFLPAAVFYGGGLNGYDTLEQQLAMANLSHDAALIAIALVQHRRQTGEWPEELAALTPELLPEVPRDLYATDEAPLKYRVVDGQPLLYSVGPNQQDDGGTSPADDKSPTQAEDGDWVLLPPWEPAL